MRKKWLNRDRKNYLNGRTKIFFKKTYYLYAYYLLKVNVVQVNKSIKNIKHIHVIK